jgi:hypothetical protein
LLSDIIAFSKRDARLAGMPIPDAITRRDLLYGPNVPVDELLRLGQAYLAGGRILDALEFFARAGAKDALTALRTRAIECGDAFIGIRLEQLGEAALTPSEWQALADAASARGLMCFAATATTRANATAQ